MRTGVLHRNRPKMYRLTEPQQEVLNAVAAQCQNPDCEGACNLGFLEPIEGWFLRSARALARQKLLYLVNGSRGHWIAAHVTRVGRDLAHPRIAKAQEDQPK